MFWAPSQLFSSIELFWSGYEGAIAYTGFTCDAAYGMLPDFSFIGFFGIGGQDACSGGKRPTGGFGSDGTGRGERGDSYIARIEMAPMASDAAYTRPVKGFPKYDLSVASILAKLLPCSLPLSVVRSTKRAAIDCGREMTLLTFDGMDGCRDGKTQKDRK